MKFIPLHVNSGYSILKSGIKINDYILLATKFGYDTVGMTDINSFCGLPKFNDLAKKNNLKPIFGLDLMYARFYQEFKAKKYRLKIRKHIFTDVL